MPGANEVSSRVKIDAQRDQRWNVLDTHAVRVEVVLPDRTKVDYAFYGPRGERGRTGETLHTAERAFQSLLARVFSGEPTAVAGEASEEVAVA